MSLVRTSELVTCGITNIPLTKPARLFFIIPNKDNEKINQVYSIYNSIDCQFTRKDLLHSGMTRFISKDDIPSNFIKMVWNNFRSLKPKFQSSWRYFLWELDGQEYYNTIVELYNKLHLPVYIHRSMRGWHFISIKPIEFKLWKQLTEQIQYTNPTFPRITLRVKPNKYLEEEKIFNDGFIMGNYHSDTHQLRNWIEHGNYDKIGERYQLVYYNFDGKEHDRFEQ